MAPWFAASKRSAVRRQACFGIRVRRKPTPKPRQYSHGKFEAFVEAVSRDFAQPELPFYYVQIGRYVSSASPREWNAVQEAQRVLADKIRKSGVVAAIDFSLDDAIHVSTPGQKRLGVRLANLAAGKAKSPNVVSAQYESSSSGFGLIKVKFANVTGKLQSEGRVSGFGLYTPAGEWIPAIFRADVDPADGSTILLHVSGKIPEDAVLYYGYGRDPYCNLRDDADMGVLVFGPASLKPLGRAKPDGIMGFTPCVSAVSPYFCCPCVPGRKACRSMILRTRLSP